MVNARAGRPAKEICDIITSKLSNFPYITLGRQSAFSNPLTLDMIKNWLPIKRMPYGTDLGGWRVENLKSLGILGFGSNNSAHLAHGVVSKQEILEMVGHYKVFACSCGTLLSDY